MKASLVSALVFAVFSAPAFAQNDNCIENVDGVMVCGVAADAVRARLRAEQRYREQLADGEIEPGEAPRQKQFRSVYGAFGQAAFLRGGYAFAAHGNGSSGSVDGIIGSVGYRRALQPRTNGLSLEGEVVYLRDGEDGMLFGVPLETTTIGVTGIFALRWDANPTGVITPYVSAGVGPAYYDVEIESGDVSVSDGAVFFGYSGRAGLEAQLSDRISLEAGYRYLGATRDGNVGIHSGEMGLNYNF